MRAIRACPARAAHASGAQCKVGGEAAGINRENAMRLKALLLGSALALAAAMPASAEEIYIPLLTYRTGGFAVSGVQIGSGMADYLNMLNERDGGIGGVKLNVEECETGYDTKKGVECYEQVKGKNPIVINPYSTGITLQMIPKAAVDKIPVLSMATASRHPRTGRTSRGFSIRRRPTGTAHRCS